MHVKSQERIHLYIKISSCIRNMSARKSIYVHPIITDDYKVKWKAKALNGYSRISWEINRCRPSADHRAALASISLRNRSHVFVCPSQPLRIVVPTVINSIKSLNRDAPTEHSHRTCSHRIYAREMPSGNCARFTFILTDLEDAR